MGRAELIDLVRDSVIGNDEVVDGPYGPRPVVYADYTARGRSLSFFEAYLDDVMTAFVHPPWLGVHVGWTFGGRD